MIKSVSRIELVPIEPKKNPVAAKQATGGSLEFISLDSRERLEPIGAAAIPQLALDTPKKEAAAQQDDGACIRRKIETADGAIWIEGNALLCSCPDCGAPMSVRLIISAASCWLCGTDIQLSAEQQAAAEALLQQTQNAPVESPSQPESTPTNEPARRKKRKKQQRQRPQPTRQPQSTARRTITSRNREFENRRTPQAVLQQLLQGTPAWFVSFILHLVVLLVLAMLWIPNLLDTKDDEAITLTTFISTDDVAGGDLRVVDPEASEEYDLPHPPEANLANRNVRSALAKADQDAKALRVDPNPSVKLADIGKIKQRLATKTGQNYRFLARDPRMRVEMIQNEGGTMLTEAAVARGLRWLASVQNDDGSWSLENWKKSKNRGNKGDAAATYLALLPFLGAGQTHEYGIYKETVSKGLKWTLDHQLPNGDLRDDLPKSYAMYAQGQGAIVLIETLAMTGDERFRKPSQTAIDFIVKAQHHEGGWRYRPKERGDTSIFGWQMMALQSALSPELGLDVPESTLKLADLYLDGACNADKSRYKYTPNRDSKISHTMTAEALLCRMYLGWKRDDPRLMNGMDWLSDKHLPSTRKRNIYYWYYATQAMHHYGGRAWEVWNREMSDILVKMQDVRGRYAGSWTSDGYEYGGQGGRIYVTALAVCCLEVYYRHLPIFKQLDIE